MTNRPGGVRRSAPRGFSDEESFGFFMEAVRELQLYEDEAAKSESDPASLHQHLRDALDSLEQCRRLYPDDLMPRYYLGIALTMENQVFYARLLRDRQPAPALSGAAPASPASGTVKAEIAETDVGPFFPALPDRPWPLLDRALDCFDRNDEFALVPELRDAALFNGANVCVRLGTAKSYDRAVNILQDLLKRRGQPRTPGRFAWLTAWTSSERQKRQEDEETAFSLSVQILLSATIAMREVSTKKKAAKAEVETAVAELTRCRDRAGNEIGDAVARHDVLADALTKRALVKYFFAVSAVPWTEPTLAKARLDPVTNVPNNPLVDAADDLEEALQHKSNWLPAQTYLAQVYQALGRPKKAEEQLSSVLGKPAEKQAVA